MTQTDTRPSAEALEAKAKERVEKVESLIADRRLLRETLIVYACDSSEHAWGNDAHPCFKYKSCLALEKLHVRD